MWALQHISRLIFSQTECLIMLIFAVLVVCNEYLEDLVLINLSSMTMILKIQLKITKIIIGQLSIIGCLHRLSIVCHFNTNIDFKLIVANHVPFLVYFKLHIIFKVISIWFHVCNSFCVSIKHITLICQHDKLPLVLFVFDGNVHMYIFNFLCFSLSNYTGWPTKNGTVDTVDFRTLPWSTVIFFHLAG